MSDEKQSDGKLLAERYNESWGNPSGELLEEIGQRFAPERAAPPPAGEDPPATPARPLAEVMKESRGGHDTDKLADHLSRFQLAEDGRTLIDPVAEQAATEAAAQEQEARAREMFQAREIEDSEWRGEAAAKIIQFAEANFPPDEAAKMLEQADTSHSVFMDLFAQAKRKELADMVAYGRAHYPDTYRNFQSSEEREFEAARNAEKEKLEKLQRRKVRLQKEMQSSDSRVSQRAEAQYITEFVKHERRTT